MLRKESFLPQCAGIVTHKHYRGFGCDNNTNRGESREEKLFELKKRPKIPDV